MREGGIHAASGGIGIAGVDDLDADRAGSQALVVLPFAFTGVPGALAFIYHAIDARLVLIAYQIMHADIISGQQLDGALQVRDRVMDDQEAGAAILHFS